MRASRRVVDPAAARAETAWSVLTRHPSRFLFGRWPWLALAYAVPNGVLAAAVASRPSVALLVSPLLVLAVGAAERRRVTLLGCPRITSGHAHVPLRRWWTWPIVRFSERATWRDAAHLLVLTFSSLPIALILLLDMVIAVSVGSLVARPADAPSMLASFSPIVLADDAVVLAIVLCAVLLAGYVTVHAVVVTAIAVAQSRAADSLLSAREQELERQVGRLAESRVALVDSFETERERIERDLHDGVQQRLVALTMSLGLAEVHARRVESSGAPVAELLASLDAAHAHAEEALDDLRRTVRGVHAPVLADHGLHAALTELAARTPVPVHVRGLGHRRLPPEIERCAYFVASEALTNAMKHADATSVSIDVRVVERDGLVLDVRDDGRGGADPLRGSGLRGLAGRAEILGGRVDIASPMGGPTSVTLTLPLPDADAVIAASPD
jgi:signal transduction histidine kinase